MLPFYPANLPPELVAGKKHVPWKSVPRPDKPKPDKLPLRPRTSQEQLASHSDPTTWGEFGVALAVAERNNYAGVFRALTLEDQLTFIDLDNCRNPETEEIEGWAWEIINFVRSYTEVSPSGQGVHIFAHGTLPKGDDDSDRRRTANIEMYCETRFASLTGWLVPGAPTTIEDRSKELLLLHEQIFPREIRQPSRGRSRHTPPLSDTDILRIARGAKNSAKFNALWSGDTSMHDGDHSRADAALCKLLAFYTQDESQIERLMGDSELGRRDKWRKRRDYRRRTIQGVLAIQRDYYQPTRQSNPAPSTRPERTVPNPGPAVNSRDTGTEHQASASEKFTEADARPDIEDAPAYSEPTQGPPRTGPTLLSLPHKVWERVEPMAREQVIKDLIPAGAIANLFADGGTGKSLVALCASTCVVLGIPFAGKQVQQGSVVYVDAELDLEEFTRRAYQVARGFGLDKPPEGLFYYRLDGPLGDIAVQERATRAISLCNPRMTVLDSLTIASYGSDAKEAGDMISVLKYVETWGTVLTIDHIPKPMPGVNQSGYRPYGSAFKFNLARSVLQAISAPAGGISIRQTKHSFGPKADPINLVMEFSPGKVVFQTVDAADSRMAGVEDNLPAIEQVYRALAAYNDGSTPEFLAKELEKATKTVKNHLTALRHAKRAFPLGDGIKWIADLYYAGDIYDQSRSPDYIEGPGFGTEGQEAQAA